MIFAWIGILKLGAGPVPQDVQLQVSDFIGQPYIDVRAVGAMRNDAGERCGMMMLFEVDDWAKARAFVEGSPYLHAGLYERHELFEYRSEVGGF